MHEPWQLVLLTGPDGSTLPTRVWLPPLSGVGSPRDEAGGDRHPELPEQREPAHDGDA